MIHYNVLLLNQNYEPLNVCPMRRAVVLVDKGKAEVLENGLGHIRSISRYVSAPSVIRLVYQVKRPMPQRHLSRKETFMQDKYRCQYCGVETHDLTLDHVVPRYRGGRHEWSNVVSACNTCNHRKGNLTPVEAGMSLRSVPGPPPTSPYYPFVSYLDKRTEWRKFIPHG